MNGLVAGYDTEEEEEEEEEEREQQRKQEEQRPPPSQGAGATAKEDEAALGPLQGPAMPPPPSPMEVEASRSEPWRSPLPSMDESRGAQLVSPAPGGPVSAELRIEGIEGEGEEEELPLDTTYFDQLPPEPPGECDPELQQRVIDFLAKYGSGVGKTGFTANLKEKKDFGNPELLQRIIEVFGIDEHSSNYPTHLFDPHGYAEDDYADRVRAIQRQLEMEAITQQQAKAAHAAVASGMATLPPLHPSVAAGRAAAAAAAAAAAGVGVGVAGGGGGGGIVPPGAAAAIQQAQAAAAAAAGRVRSSKWGAAPPQPPLPPQPQPPMGPGRGGGAGPGGLPSAVAALQARMQMQLQMQQQQQQQQAGGVPGGRPSSRPPSQGSSPMVPPLGGGGGGGATMRREGSVGQELGAAGGRKSKFTDAGPS